MEIKPSNVLQSLPPYAFKEVDDAAAALKAQGITPIDFGVGDPSESTPEFVQESLAPAAKKHARTGYPSYIGSCEFREICSKYMDDNFNVDLDPETEICSNIGSKEAIFNFPNAFINPGDTVIIPSPGYPPMKTGTLFAGGVPYFVPLLSENDFLIDYELIPEEVAEKAKIMWINYPNSPTGASATREYYEGLVAWAHSHNIIIAADEGCYIDIYFGEKPISILEVSREGIVVFYSLSKRNNMTGYRVGFVAGDEEIISIYKKLKTNIDSGTPNVIQEAAMIALSDVQYVGKMRDLYKKKGEILMEALGAIGLEVRKPRATFYIWQKVPGSDVEFAKKLLDPEIGIVVMPGSLISDECEEGVNPGAGYVRFALMPTLEEVEKAARRLVLSRDRIF
ncbi:aminotransferase class I/II-fold pyridoxal phosphate-dependent enzyme [Patescibacteria group bacterium]|nr:aminotransferase class I/II-fold pyridoxal phosphate-dependent enzyme [Patescibacteria group bacterium]